MAASSTDDAAAEAAGVALKIGSFAVDTASFVVDLGEELPMIRPVLKTLKAINGKVETVKNNREGLRSLEERCTYVTACFIVKCRQRPNSEMDITPLVDCIETARKFVERCSRRSKVSRVLKASSDKEEIAGLNARVDRLTGDLGLIGIATLNGKANATKAMLVSCTWTVCGWCALTAQCRWYHSCIQHQARSKPIKYAQLHTCSPRVG